jgi:phosphoenolpyruvate-protein kinase (PTS system EI component)
MISSLSEVLEAKAILQECAEELKTRRTGF